MSKWIITFVCVCFFCCGKKPDPEHRQKSLSKYAFEQEVLNQSKNCKYYVPKGELFRFGMEEYYNIIKTIKMTPEEAKEKLKSLFEIEYVAFKKIMEEFKAEDIKAKDEWLKTRLGGFNLLGVQDSFFIYTSLIEMKETDKLNIRTKYQIIIESYGVNIETGQVVKLKLE